ncbi:MAG: sugar metabolism transcriptional regulator [Gammaproteobacteria bacterium]|nr:sugar metabolism transcriptional regulator [Gammaproteobacteria bacterium]
MILRDLKNYVKSHRQVSLKDVALHFDVEPEAARGMLEFWIKNGKIRKHRNPASCGGSCSCSYREDDEIYLWNPELGQVSIELNGTGTGNSNGVV